ncbi:trypsin-like peptidase domain-containing protein [Glycomyces sp. NPDC021274]|uniref:trypsin-like peptidase domain-containing protein n=1 Tax=Glycomyces sp. NPDC021274 TaxID=3155120 RepID=UPI0033D919FE
MSEPTPDARLARLVKIRVRDSSGDERIVGTGVALAPGLALTARHVLKQLVRSADGPDADLRNTAWADLDDHPVEVLRVASAGGDAGLAVGSVVELDPGHALDAVVLIVPGLPAPPDPCPAARHTLDAPLELCRIIGYPVAATDDGSVQPEYVGARLVPISRNVDGLLSLDITTARPGERSGWKGLSGAGACDASGRLLGIVTHVPGRLEGRLLALSISAIRTTAATVDRTDLGLDDRATLDTLAALDIEENPLVQEAEEGRIAQFAHHALDFLTPVLPGPVKHSVQLLHGAISERRFSKEMAVALAVPVLLVALLVTLVAWPRGASDQNGGEEPTWAATEAVETEAFVPSDPPSPEPSPSATEGPATGSTIWNATVADNEWAATDGVIGASSTRVEGGLAVRLDDDEIFFSTYELESGNLLAGPVAMIPPSEPGCGMTVARRHDGTSLVLDAYEIETPAQGTAPATREVVLRASDATTLTTLWETKYNLEEGAGCLDAIGGKTRYESTMEFSADQRHVFWDSRIFDLDDGSAMWLGESTIERPTSIFVAGSQLAWYESDDHTIHFNNMSTLEIESSLALEDDVYPNDLLTPWGSSLIWSSEEAVYSTDVHGSRTWMTEVEAEVYDVEPIPDSDIAVMLHDPGVGVPWIGAIDLSDGTILWDRELDEFEYCGALDGNAAIIIHDQYAVLDLDNGEDVTYDSERSSCPLVLPGVAVVDGEFKSTLV